MQLHISIRMRWYTIINFNYYTNIKDVHSTPSMLLFHLISSHLISSQLNSTVSLHHLLPSPPSKQTDERIINFPQIGLSIFY